ncbi:MAG TPA: hypothetical protein VHA52_01025 [Candidatus Babeliaceae bacterium]|nr:hypothetical protein [Candidatus Babeliaceae bacterium]
MYYGIIAFDTPLILYESIVPAHTRLQLSTINCCYQAYPLSSTHAYHVGISHALLYQYQLICARAAISLLSITTTTVAKLTYLYQANPAFDAQDLTIIEQSIEPSKTDYAIINGLKTLASSFNL